MPTEIWSWQVKTRRRKGEEGEKEKEKEQATLIKSRGRHLAGGEI